MVVAFIAIDIDTCVCYHTEKNIVPMPCWIVKRAPDCEKQNLSKICMFYALYESLYIPFKQILSLSAQGCIL